MVVNFSYYCWYVGRKRDMALSSPVYLFEVQWSIHSFTHKDNKIEAFVMIVGRLTSV